MKIIHTGDIHIGSALKNLPPDKARLRQSELTDGFRRLCDYARDNGVSCVLIAGDLFDENNTARHIKKEILAAIGNAKPVCFFYVSGNHDDEFACDDLPENLYTFHKNHGWQSYDLGENITVTGMDTNYFSPAAFSSIALYKERYNIVLLHGDIGAGSSREAIPLSLLKERHIDYLALGHIHKPTLQRQRLDGRGTYRYCGCFESRGFDEIGPRGVFLLDVQGGILQSEKFLSFATRETCEARVDISRANTYFDIETLALESLKNIKAENAVKIVLCGRFKPDLRKDLGLLSRRLSSRFFALKIEDESRLFLDLPALQTDKTERGEFIKEVGRYAFTDEMREEILEVGLKALSGEEIDL